MKMQMKRQQEDVYSIAQLDLLIDQIEPIIPIISNIKEECNKERNKVRVIDKRNYQNNVKMKKSRCHHIFALM